MPDPSILTLALGDVVRLPRPHPRAGDTWRVDRLGADIGLRCDPGLTAATAPTTDEST